MQISFKDLKYFLEACSESSNEELVVKFNKSDLDVVNQEGFIVGSLDLKTGSFITYKPEELV